MSIGSALLIFENGDFHDFMEPSAITLSNFDSFSVVSSTLHSAVECDRGVRALLGKETAAPSSPPCALFGAARND